MRWRIITLTLALAVAACAQGEPEPRSPLPDPIARQALWDEIATDPDLVGQNLADTALGGGTDHSIPAIVDTQDARDAARGDAIAVVGTDEMSRALPAPRRDPDPIPDPARASVAARAALVPGLSDCAGRASFTAMWAARLPAAMPLFPRANTLEAAGTDEGGCSLRAVRFATPAAQSEVLAFYAALLRRAGLPVRYTLRDGDAVLSAAAGGRTMALFARSDAAGITRGELIVAGFGGP